MPELPEVQTTMNALKEVLPGLGIRNVWTDYHSRLHEGKDDIKNPNFFRAFKDSVTGNKVVSLTRRGKNILIHLSNGKTILIHMKLTGHLLYGRYKLCREAWAAVEDGSLKTDPHNSYIRLVFTLSNGKHLALSDLRRFAKVTLSETHAVNNSSDIKNLGPEPLYPNFTADKLASQLRQRRNASIKTVLMDQTLISGIGNIYSDEILWKAGVHPLTKVKRLRDVQFKRIHQAMRQVLKKALRLKGTSAFNYRHPNGEKGKYQFHCLAYQREGEECTKVGCGGRIKRMIVGGRSAHFCEIHQRL